MSEEESVEHEETVASESVGDINQHEQQQQQQQQEEEKEQTTTTTTPSLSFSLTSTVKKGIDLYHKFNLRDEIEDLRVNTNSILSKADPVMHLASHFSRNPFKLKDDLALEAYLYSDDLNKRHPYLASMCRSHEKELVGTAVTVSALALWKLPRRMYFFSVFSAFAVAQGTCCLFNFKWKTPVDPARLKEHHH
eukprot:gene5590-6154_t